MNAKDIGISEKQKEELEAQIRFYIERYRNQPDKAETVALYEYCPICSFLSKELRACGEIGETHGP